ncbi:MAG: hypothetical protein OXR84_15900 [Magnetovibrio sp.]|nr:hypothetical protein [Magnetovibrio sp.]
MTLNLRPGVALMVVALAGCSTFSDLKAGLQDMMGRPAGDLVERFGPPRSKAPKDGGTLYTWRHAHPYTSLIPEPSFHYMTLAGVTGWFPIPTYSTETNIHSCVVEATADAEGILQASRFSGNRSACAYFTERIGR